MPMGTSAFRSGDGGLKTMLDFGFIQNSKLLIQNSGFWCRRGRRRSDWGWWIEDDVGFWIGTDVGFWMVNGGWGLLILDGGF